MKTKHCRYCNQTKSLALFAERSVACKLCKAIGVRKQRDFNNFYKESVLGYEKRFVPFEKLKEIDNVHRGVYKWKKKSSKKVKKQKFVLEPFVSVACYKKFMVL